MQLGETITLDFRQPHDCKLISSNFVQPASGNLSKWAACQGALTTNGSQHLSP